MQNEISISYIVSRLAHITTTLLSSQLSSPVLSDSIHIFLYILSHRICLTPPTMSNNHYPIHRSQGLASPNELTIGDSSFADASADFSVYSDGISSIADSAISHQNVNKSYQGVPPPPPPSPPPPPLDPSSPEGTLYNDPYASVVDSESGASPSLHLGSDNEKNSKDAADSTGGVVLARRFSTRRVGMISQTKNASTGTDKNRNDAGCCTLPEWISDAPLLIKLVMLVSAALLVGASVLLIIVAIGNSTRRSNSSSLDFGPVMDNNDGRLGVIPSASFKETTEPTSHPTIQPHSYPITFIPTSLAPTVAATTQSSNNALVDCHDFDEPFAYMLKSGVVQSADSCADLVDDFRFFVLKSICVLSVVDVPAIGATLVSDRCPRMCQACNTTKSPSSAPSAGVKILAPPSPAPTDRREKSTFFVTGGHFKRDDDIGPLLGRLPGVDGASEGTFLVHLGDMNRPQWRDCDKRSFEIITEMWASSAIPLFAIPGEMDYLECRWPDDALWYFQEYLVGINECCWDDFEVKMDVSRQASVEENFAFVQHGVLYIGLHLISGPEIPDKKDWSSRLDANLDWLIESFATNRDQVEVVVVFGHSTPDDEANQDFFAVFAGAVESWGVPVMYFHQDDDGEYPWTWQRNLLGVSNFLDVSVRAKLWPPLRVVIDTEANTFNLDDENWHVGLLDDNIYETDGSLQVMDAGGV